MRDLAVIGGAIALVSLVRVRIGSLPLTTAMVFVAIGMLLAPEATGWLDLRVGDEGVALLAELTLALLLFSDAVRIDLRRSTGSIGLPVRLLGIGLPLAVAMGAALTGLLLTDLSWAEAALVAAILAPTDAALGEAVVSNPAVPARIRQALNIESGLNDGLVVPIVAVFTALVDGEAIGRPWDAVLDALEEIGLGVLIGVAVAIALGFAVRIAASRGWTDAEGFRLVALGAALVAFGAAASVLDSGFVAAFVCGLVARRQLGRELCEHAELAEDLGQVGAAATFMLFGALLVWPALGDVTGLVIACAIGTLTVGRMVPVAVSMIGSGLRARSVLFLGWFGPRGLASMVFGLLLIGDDVGDRPEDLFSVIVLVILSSVVLHGLTAAPAARRYGAWYAEGGEEHMPEESVEVGELPTRGSLGTMI